MEPSSDEGYLNLAGVTQSKVGNSKVYNDLYRGDIKLLDVNDDDDGDDDDLETKFDGEFVCYNIDEGGDGDIK